MSRFFTFDMKPFHICVTFEKWVFLNVSSWGKCGSRVICVSFGGIFRHWAIDRSLKTVSFAYSRNVVFWNLSGASDLGRSQLVVHFLDAFVGVMIERAWREVQTSRERPESAPYLRLKNSKRTTVPALGKNWKKIPFFSKFFWSPVSPTLSKNVKGGPLGFFEHPFFCKIEKKWRGDLLETLKKFAKKNLTRLK